MDWARIMKQAGQLGGERMVYLGLWLANNLLGTALPGTVWATVQADPMVKSLALQAQEWLFRADDDLPGVFDRHFFYLKTIERLPDQVRYGLRTVMAPTVIERTVYRYLPVFLFFIMCSGQFGWLKSMDRLY